MNEFIVKKSYSNSESKIAKKTAESRKMKRQTTATMQYNKITESQYVDVLDFSSVLDLL